MAPHHEIARHACETVLAADRQYNIDHQVWRSAIPILDRMLARGTELTAAYEEVFDKLHGSRPHSLKTFFTVVVETAVEWSPEKNAAAREARAELVAVNKDIAATASALAVLLRRRFDLHNRSGFHSQTHYTVCDVIAAAGQGNGRFTGWLEKPFEALHAEYDSKYWPTLSELMDELAADADKAEVRASDPLTEAATEGSRNSKAGYVRALFVALDENRGDDFNDLPMDFKLTDETFASLINCVLDLGPEEMVDGPYVKRLRQRAREG